MAVFGEQLRDFCEGHAGFDAEGEVAGIVGDYFVEARHIEGEIVAGGRVTNAQFCARAGRDQRQFFRGSKFYDFGDFFARGRTNGGGGEFAVNFVGGELREIARDVCGADNFVEACGDARADGGGVHLDYVLGALAAPTMGSGRM